MNIEDVAPTLRTKDAFHHIDIGFLNRRLCLTALPPDVRQWFIEHQKPGSDHMTVLGNDHLLVTVLLDVCETIGALTLLGALALGKPKQLFRSTEKLAPCPEIYNAVRVDHAVELSIDFGKPVRIAYHTSHLISDTGRLTLAQGAAKGHFESIVGLLHDKPDHYEIEPLVIGAPWYDHPRNAADSDRLMWLGGVFGELLPEDFDQFAEMKGVQPADASEWMDATRRIPEAEVKAAFARLLAEPTKKDWAGEPNDHFSSNVYVGGERRTAAFLLKGPADFREMTLDMCGARADQIHRLVNSGADISVVQHAHLIGPVVRETLRQLTIYPGARRRKYCLIDGQATYRILKAYSIL